MFFHRQELQFSPHPTSPTRCTRANRKRYSAASTARSPWPCSTCSFQGWNTHLPGKYRDLVFGIGGEEFGHVEMLATMIAQLLEKAPLGITGARPVDSNGNPWQGTYITGSGNQHQYSPSGSCTRREPPRASRYVEPQKR